MMREKMIFEDKGAFLDTLRTLAAEKVPGRVIRVMTPFFVHEVEEIIPPKPGKVKGFALTGAATGTVTGFLFTILTSLSWPIITGGKPIVSIPAFIIIAFALTILFGALATFAGFLILARMPSVETIISGEEYGNRFVICVEEKEQR